MPGRDEVTDADGGVKRKKRDKKREKKEEKKKEENVLDKAVEQLQVSSRLPRRWAPIDSTLVCRLSFRPKSLSCTKGLRISVTRASH